MVHRETRESSRPGRTSPTTLRIPPPARKKKSRAAIKKTQSELEGRRTRSRSRVGKPSPTLRVGLVFTAPLARPRHPRRPASIPRSRVGMQSSTLRVVPQTPVTSPSPRDPRRCFPRSHAPAWECSPRRSASSLQRPSSLDRHSKHCPLVPTLLRGTAVLDAPRRPSNAPPHSIDTGTKIHAIGPTLLSAI